MKTDSEAYLFNKIGVYSRVEKACSDGKNLEVCLNHTLNDTKRFVFIEQYKTYSNYEGDNTVTTIEENIFRKIISTDNEVCKYTKNT